MNVSTPTLREQYMYIRQSRQVLLDFCGQLSDEEFHRDNGTAGRGSVNGLLTHNGNCYLFWIGEICLGRKMAYADYGSLQDLNGIRRHFDEVDRLMETLLAEDSLDLTAERTYTLQGQPGQAPLLKIVTHVLTHEFHHKGQILSLTRQMGYVPVDTDVMR